MSDESSSSQECVDGGVGARTACILSYGGETTDIIINYTLFALNLIWCIIAMCFHTNDIEKKGKLRRFAIGSLLFVIVFQISVCLLVYCSGISIVWCAMGGWIVSERKRLRLYDPQTQGEHLFRRFSVVAEMFVVFIDISAIIYYAFVTPFLTTFAHVMSLILGATLSLISIKRYDEDHGQRMESATPATPLMM